jgi:hypothetical protein
VNTHGWLMKLSPHRRKGVVASAEKSQRTNGFVDTLLLTHLGDKADIVLKTFFAAQHTTEIAVQLEKLRHLRNKLAHADEYAASPAAARNVCRIVRSLISLQSELVRYAKG